MCEIVIRRIESSDVAHINKLGADDKYWEQQINVIAQSFLREVNCEHSFVALHQDVIIGFIYGGIFLETTFIPHFMYVSPEFRKQGVGQKLLQTTEQESECTSSLAYYHKSLHDYYEKQGYIQGTELEIAIKPLERNNE